MSAGKVQKKTRYSRSSFIIGFEFDVNECDYKVGYYDHHINLFYKATPTGKGKEKYTLTQEEMEQMFADDLIED